MERQSKVLVVDDDPFALRSIAKVLEGGRYQVMTAANGSEALDLLRQESFDLVLTDLKMPEVDGLEVLRQAREIAPQAVVLILTGYASVESAIEALREGAYDYLVKPYSADELRLKIERGLERVRLAKERQRAEEEIRRRNRELAALNTIATTMMQSALGLDEMLQRIADGVVEGLGCNTAVMLLLDEKEGVFKCRAVSTRGKIIKRINALIGFPLSQIKFPARSDFNEAVSNALDGRITIKQNLYELTHPVLSKPVCFALEKLAGSRTFLSLPLLAKGKVVGGIFASTREEEISEGYTETMTTFANQAAIAIENARLYEETRQRALEQETLREAALALTTALDRNKVIDRILAQLQQVVPYDSASVQLLQGDRLVLIGGRGFPNLEELLGTSFPVDSDNPNREVMRTLSPFILEDAPARDGHPLLAGGAHVDRRAAGGDDHPGQMPARLLHPAARPAGRGICCPGGHRHRERAAVRGDRRAAAIPGRGAGSRPRRHRYHGCSP